MQNLSGTKSASRRRKVAAALTVALGVMAWQGEALAWTGQPLAYVISNGGVSVIDTGDNKVVDTVPVGQGQAWIAVAPDGIHVYVVDLLNATSSVPAISVIETVNKTDSVVTTIPLDPSIVGEVPLGTTHAPIAVSPDGTQVYAATQVCISGCPGPQAPNRYLLWAINTADNSVAAPVSVLYVPTATAVTPDGQHLYVTNTTTYVLPPPDFPEFATSNLAAAPNPVIENGATFEIAVNPDGKHAYVNNGGAIWVVDTNTNTIIGTVTVGQGPQGIAVTPDGTRVYVANSGDGTVSIINTASNMVQTVSVGASPNWVAVTPDGRHAYVTNSGSNNVSVIDTTSNAVVATVPVAGPGPIAIVPPPQGAPFTAFSIKKLDIALGGKGKSDSFNVKTSFTLNSALSNGANPGVEPVKFQVGPFIATIPAGSFTQQKDGSYAYDGVMDGVSLKVEIKPTGTLRYAFHAKATGADLSGTTNPVQVSLGVDGEAGLSAFAAQISQGALAAADD